MKSAQWTQIKALLDAVKQLPSEQRDTYLETQCHNNPELLREVRSILRVQENARRHSQTTEHAPSPNSGVHDDPLVGQEIDGYHIIDVLGRGGMGVVYKAQNLTLDRTEALKIIGSQFVQDAEFLHRFKREAQALARFHHANIVTIFALQQSRLGYYITMEFVEGETLADIIAIQGIIPWKKSLPLIKQLLSAFSYAHTRGIIHRDIKPRNIMLTPDETVKVMDFGLAKFYQQHDITLTQGISGTPYYMSPEQIKGDRKLDQRSDIFALGMTLYEVLSGSLPFAKGSTLFKIQRAIVEDSFPPLHQLNKAVPADLSAIIMKALEKDIESRYQRVEEIANDLQAFEQAQAARGDTITQVAEVDDHTVDLMPPYVPKPKRRLPWAKMGIGAGILAVLAIIGFFLLRPSAPPEVFATIDIASTPSGATIWIDGESIGTTPLQSYEIYQGDIALEIRKTGYVSVDSTLTLAEGQHKLLSMALQIDTMGIALSTVAITSTPSGAQVWIDDQNMGTTPLETQIPSGNIAIRLQKDGFESWTQNITLTSGESRPLVATLEAVSGELATFEITSTPSGASVWIDGENLGTTPLERQIATGNAAIRLQKDGFEPWSRTITLEAGDNPTVAATLRRIPPQRGTLTVNAVPTGPITIDERNVQSSEAIALVPGGHTVRCGDGPNSAETTIEIRSGSSENLTCYFEHTIRVAVSLEDGTPTDASILLNGVDSGVTASSPLERGPGSYAISVAKEGYDMLGSAQSIIVTPAFEPKPQTLTFRLKPSRKPMRDLVTEKTTNILKELENGIINGEWSQVPQPLVEYYQKEIEKQRRRFTFISMNSTPENLVTNADETTATVTMNIFITYKQKGRDSEGALPFPSIWHWKEQNGTAVLTEIQKK